MTYRLGFTDPRLQSLYQDWIQSGRPPPSLDQGCRSIDYVRVQPGSRVGIAGDQISQSCELFEPFSLSPAFNSIYRRFSGEALPWIPSQTPVTQSLLRRFDDAVRAWREANPTLPGISEDLVRFVYHWALDPQGLGMRGEAGGPERNFDEAVAARRGDCSEFAMVLLALFSRVGFDPFPVFVRVDYQGEHRAHTVVGLELGGSTFLMDPINGHFNAPYRSFTRMSFRELLAWRWNNLAMNRETTDPAGAERAYEIALQIDPRNPHFFTNRGIFRARRGLLSAARLDFSAALRSAPRFAPAHYEMGNLDYDVGHYRDAARHFRIAAAQNPQDGDYQRNLALALNFVTSSAR